MDKDNDDDYQNKQLASILTNKQDSRRRAQAANDASQSFGLNKLAKSSQSATKYSGDLYPDDFVVFQPTIVDMIGGEEAKLGASDYHNQYPQI